VARPSASGSNGGLPSPLSAMGRSKATPARMIPPCKRIGTAGAVRGVVHAWPKAARSMEAPKPSVGNVRGVDKPCSMDRRSLSITASRYAPGEVMPERPAKGATQHVIANDTDQASLSVNRLARHARKLACAVLRGGGDGDTASLPDPPLRCGFRQRLMPGVRPANEAYRFTDTLAS
jgi:hypothetical protein